MTPEPMKEEPATIAEMADIDYEAWSEDDACVSNDPLYWERQNALTLFALNAAQTTLMRTRAENTAEARRWIEDRVCGEDGEPMVQAAAARLLVATAEALEEDK